MEYLDIFLKEMARQGLTPDGLRAMASRLEGLERAAGEPPVLRVKLLGPGASAPPGSSRTQNIKNGAVALKKSYSAALFWEIGSDG